MLKYKSLESLRGMAALIVALFHSGFYVGEKHIIIAQGEIFVDFFFILSGFVMACAYTDVKSLVVLVSKVLFYCVLAGCIHYTY
jgi:peptidoglycan/LPS O-acetylase OafA/YrhL